MGGHTLLEKLFHFSLISFLVCTLTWRKLIHEPDLNIPFNTSQQALDLLNYLVRKGVNPSSADSLGNFPFLYALCCGHLKVAAGLACLTKNLPSNWKISHPSLNIYKQQQVYIISVGF